MLIPTIAADSRQLHTPFPVLARMPFGYYFAQFVVLSRCVLAIVWLGSGIYVPIS